MSLKNESTMSHLAAWFMDVLRKLIKIYGVPFRLDKDQ